VAEATTKALFQLIVDNHHEKLKQQISWILTFYATCNNSIHCLDPKLLTQELLSISKEMRGYDFIIDSKKITDANAWIDFYDSFGRMDNLKYSHFSWKADEYPIDFVLQGFIEDTSRIGLLRLLGIWCASGSRITNKVKTLLSLESITDLRSRLAAMLICMTQEAFSSSDANQIVANISAVIGTDGEPQALSILLSTIEHHSKETPELEIILIELINHIPVEEWKLRASADALRYRLLAARSSGFDMQKLKELKLPMLLSAPA